MISRERRRRTAVRYEKGTIQLSETRDWPILVATFRGRYISSNQLFALLT